MPHASAPLSFLPESLEAVPLCFVPLRRRILPVSPECFPQWYRGLSDYGRCAFGSGGSASPIESVADYSVIGRAILGSVCRFPEQ
jgi:hypothetical protein